MPRGVVVRMTGSGEGGSPETFASWTPVDFYGLVGFSGGPGIARYSRIGSQVQLWATFGINPNVSAAGVLIAGLPFPVRENALYADFVGSGFGDPVRGYVFPRMDPSLSCIRLYNANGVALTYSQLSGSTVRFSLAYETV